LGEKEREGVRNGEVLNGNAKERERERSKRKEEKRRMTSYFDSDFEVEVFVATQVHSPIGPLP